MKIITNPTECGYRQKSKVCYHPNVFHPILTDKTCINDNKFPDKCPLPNAIELALHMTATSKCIHYFGSYKCDLRTDKVNDHCVGKTCGDYEIKT